MAKNLTMVTCFSLFALCFFGNRAEALGPKGVGVKVGINLGRQQAIVPFAPGSAVGGQFDSAKLMMGGTLDLGSTFLPKLHLVSGGDLIHQADLNIISINTEFWYFFHQSDRVRGYAGGGIGAHLHRHKIEANETKISLNIPIGFQRKLGPGTHWFGEIKLVLGDDESDSSLQFSVGLGFGSF